MGAHFPSRLFLSCLAGLCLAGSVAAQEPRPVRAINQDPVDSKPQVTFREFAPNYAVAEISVSPDGTTLFLVGKIEETTFPRFMQVLRANPRVTTVVLSSSGGMTTPGYLIGNAVRTRNLVTRVEHECSSSCTQIFAAGRERVLGPDAKLGFHQTYWVNMQTGETQGTDYTDDADLAQTIRGGDRFAVMQNADERAVRALRRAGVSEAFIAHVLRTPPEEMWYPETAELLSEHMATGVAEALDPQMLPSGAIIREAAEAFLLERPLWQAIRQHQPERFADVVVATWRDLNVGRDRENTELGRREEVLTDLATLLPTLPDALLDRFAVAFGDQGRLERTSGYPYCRPPGTEGQVPKEAFDALRDRFDQLYVELLATPATVAKPTPEQANHTLDRNRRRLLQTGVDFSENPVDDAGYCRASERMVEAIGLLEPRRRVEAFRAWISL